LDLHDYRCSRRGQPRPTHSTLACALRAYDACVLDELRVAVDALNRGDPEPFCALIDEASEWRGIARGHLWWKQVPS